MAPEEAGASPVDHPIDVVDIADIADLTAVYVVEQRSEPGAGPAHNRFLGGSCPPVATINTRTVEAGATATLIRS